MPIEWIGAGHGKVEIIADGTAKIAHEQPTLGWSWPLLATTLPSWFIQFNDRTTKL